MTGFSRVAGELVCDDLPVAAAAARFGTPLYLYSAAAIREAFAAYSRAFAPVPHRICYALKANGSGAILRLLRSLGAGADIVSGGELRAALRAGFAPERIVFSGVGKSEDEIALGVESAIAAFNVESEQEIERIAAAARRLGQRARVALRVNPNIDPRSHPYISTGLKENKFGVDIRLAEEILGRARERPEIEVAGVQCHIGSQISDLAPLQEAARELARLARRLLDRGFALRTIDIGGGLGVDYEGGALPDADGLAERVLEALAGLPLTLLLEPGRSLLARAGALVTRVQYVKQNRGKRFVIVDAGMNDLLRPSLYQAFHRIEPVAGGGGAAGGVAAAGDAAPGAAGNGPGATGAAPEIADVVGPVCETGDFLARSRPLAPAAPGDLLAVLDAGAYGFAMASNYNMRPRAAEAMVEGGEARLIRRRESFADLVATEVD